jgi:hypothetical protein
MVIVDTFAELTHVPSPVPSENHAGPYHPSKEADIVPSVPEMADFILQNFTGVCASQMQKRH